ncbi:MAG: hypothetical protein P8L18_13645, partial [Verrucomicrobiota bacterium]|nr:hypothetical protein [Verrucomicrobiota bacterium]
RDNPIPAENRKAGTRDWMLSNGKVDPATRYRSPWVEGFCSKQSYQVGDVLSMSVSTRPASPFMLDVYRLGFYGGKGGRHMGQWGPVQGHEQPDPNMGAKRLRDCRWEPSLEWTIPSDWLSGVYLGKLTSLKGGFQSYVVFILRDHREVDYLFQCSDNTWQAYNRWPDQFSLYDNGKTQWYWGGGVAVSFNRPYGKYCQILDAPLSIGSGEFLLWEFPLAYWMEAEGYNLSYISNRDTHADPDGLERCRGFLSVGHDEYWTLEMFQNVRHAIDNGMHAAFFSGNAVCGRIKLSADTMGHPHRGVERTGVFGPPGGTREFASMSSLPHGRPYAHELVGAQSTGPVTGGADWICRRPDHWAFAGTGMKQGEGIPGLVGWEWHGDPAPIPGLEVLASGPTQVAPGQFNGGHYTATLYEGPMGNVVFNASTIWWGDGLSEPPGYLRPSVYTSPKGPDRRVQMITRNLLQRMQT